MPGRLERRGRAWLLAALVVVAVLGLDQLTKHLVETSIAHGEEQKFLPGIQLVDTRNHGVAFGLLPKHQEVVVILIGIALLFLLAYFARHSARRLIWLP